MKSASAVVLASSFMIFARGDGHHRTLMQSRLVLLSLALACLLGSCQQDRERESTSVHPGWAVGEFGEDCLTPLALEIWSWGGYTCTVSSGTVIDGCGGPFEGDGDSRGRWWASEDRIVFEPEFESPGLRLSLADVFAVRTTEGLRVQVGEVSYALSGRAPREVAAD